MCVFPSGVFLGFGFLEDHFGLCLGLTPESVLTPGRLKGSYLVVLGFEPELASERQVPSPLHYSSILPAYF